MIGAAVLEAARVAVLAALAFAVVVAGTQWAVRNRRLNPFGGWPRLVRRVSDPVMHPLERRLVRSGANPQDAALWLLGIVVVGGLVLIGLLNWLVQFGHRLGSLSSAGPRAWIVQLVRWSFTIVMAALLVRVIGSWFGVTRYNRWMRPFYVLTDWVVEPIRRVLPPLGMLDLSPMVAYLVLWLARELLVRALL